MRIVQVGYTIQDDLWQKLKEENVIVLPEEIDRPKGVPAKKLEELYGKQPPSTEKVEEHERKLEEWQKTLEAWQTGGEQGKKPRKPSAPRDIVRQFPTSKTYFPTQSDIYQIGDDQYIIIGASKTDNNVTLLNLNTRQKEVRPYQEIAPVYAERHPEVLQNIQSMNSEIARLNSRITPQGLENATKTFQNLPLQLVSLQTSVNKRIANLEAIVGGQEAKLAVTDPESLRLLEEHMDEFISGAPVDQGEQEFIEYLLDRYIYDYDQILEQISKDGVEPVAYQLKIDVPASIDTERLVSLLQLYRDAPARREEDRVTREKRKQETLEGGERPRFNLLDNALDTPLRPLDESTENMPIVPLSGFSGKLQGKIKSLQASIISSNKDKEDLINMSGKLQEFFDFLVAFSEQNKDPTVPIDNKFFGTEAGEEFLKHCAQIVNADEIRNFAERYSNYLVQDGTIDVRKMGNQGASAGNALVAAGFLRLAAVMTKFFGDRGVDPDILYDMIVPPTVTPTMPVPEPELESPREPTVGIRNVKLIVKTTEGTEIIRISRANWEVLGAKAGWIS